MWRKGVRPGSDDNLNKQEFSLLSASVIVSYYRLCESFHFLMNQMPADTKELELYMQPRWGDPRLTYAHIYCLYSVKCFNASLTMIPPSEWPTNDSFFRQLWWEEPVFLAPLRYVWIQRITSLLSRSPSYSMRELVSFSLLVDTRNIASGNTTCSRFLNYLISDAEA